MDRTSFTNLVNLIGRCTYTGEPVLPKDSLLYSEYMLLNELNPLKIDNRPLPTEYKKQLIEYLFIYPASKQKGKVTKKKIYEYLKSKGWISKATNIDSINGIDDKIKSDLRSAFGSAQPSAGLWAISRCSTASFRAEEMI